MHAVLICIARQLHVADRDSADVPVALPTGAYTHTLVLLSDSHCVLEQYCIPYAPWHGPSATHAVTYHTSIPHSGFNQRVLQVVSMPFWLHFKQRSML